MAEFIVHVYRNADGDYVQHSTKDGVHSFVAFQAQSLAEVRVDNLREEFQVASSGTLNRPSAAELLDTAIARERIVAHVGHVDPANSQSPYWAGPDFRVIRGGRHSARLNCACNGMGFLRSPGAAIRCACVRDYDEEIPF